MGPDPKHVQGNPTGRKLLAGAVQAACLVEVAMRTAVENRLHCLVRAIGTNGVRPELIGMPSPIYGTVVRRHSGRKKASN